MKPYFDLLADLMNAGKCAAEMKESPEFVAGFLCAHTMTLNAIKHEYLATSKRLGIPEKEAKKAFSRELYRAKERLEKGEC